MTITLPHHIMFGFWGSAPLPWLLIISSNHTKNAALIAHEQCHQEQQRRDGVMAFWWRYLTKPEAKLAYEVEAYKVWLKVAPQDKPKVIRWIATKYGLNLSTEEVEKLLNED